MAPAYYIRYQPTSGSPYASGSYAIVPVGTQYQNESWHELRRDLGADLKTMFGVGVEYVKWFCIRGDYDLDDLMLLDPTKYYYAAGQRVAMNQDGVVQYLHGDHGRWSTPSLHQPDHRRQRRGDGAAVV